MPSKAGRGSPWCMSWFELALLPKPIVLVKRWKKFPAPLGSLSANDLICGSKARTHLLERHINENSSRSERSICSFPSCPWDRLSCLLRASCKLEASFCRIILDNFPIRLSLTSRVSWLLRCNENVASQGGSPTQLGHRMTAKLRSASISFNASTWRKKWASTKLLASKFSLDWA